MENKWKMIVLAKLMIIKCKKMQRFLDTYSSPVKSTNAKVNRNLYF